MNPLFLVRSCCNNGGRSRIRTYDRSVMSRWLYQLSYAPISLSSLTIKLFI
jgi:hypothetical protein